MKLGKIVYNSISLELFLLDQIIFSKMIDDNQRNPRQLFNSINKLLKCNSSLHVTASTHLCNKFLDFFATKIDNVRKGICASISLSSPSVNVSYSGTVFFKFLYT